MNQSNEPIHEGNYYGPGVDRVIEHLRQINIAVPDAVSCRKPEGLEQEIPEDGPWIAPGFSLLDHAILDRFEERDYQLAQQLLHPARIGSSEWHAIDFLDSSDQNDSSNYVFAPSLLDAMAVALDTCDTNRVYIDGVESGSGKIVLRAGEVVVGVIIPVQFEPFSLHNRDRVRTAFKHVRSQFSPTLLRSRLGKLPGFDNADVRMQWLKDRANEGCLLFGYPSNWAAAMKKALADVGITVKLHQAQDLVACFFGAASWHQLAAHESEELRPLAPVCIAWGSGNSRERRVYKTAEEAVYAVGQIIDAAHVDIVINEFALGVHKYPILIYGVKKDEFESAEQARWTSFTPYIESGWDDIKDASSCPDGVIEAAKRLLRAVTDGHSDPATVLCPEDGLVAKFFAAQERAGICRENIVQAGAYYLSFDMTDTPGGTDLLGIHKMDGAAITQVAEGIALYKASLLHSPGQPNLTIKADYQRETIATIPITDTGVFTTIRGILKQSIGGSVLERGHDDVRYQR